MSLLIQGNTQFQKEDYLSALLSYQEYQNNHTAISKTLNIQTNIDLCLEKLGIASFNKPLVSVIIPTHNVEQYIERCLLSITNQTLKNIEIIVIDDGSTDKSCEIINKIANQDPRIITILNSKSSGNSGTPRNQGLHYANGEYICFVDADDYIDSTMLADLYLKGNSECADVVTSSGFYRETFGTNEVEIIDLGNISYDPNLHHSRESLLKVPQFPIIWFRMYRNDFLRQNKILLGDYKVSADVIFSLKCLLLANKIVQVDGIYYHYNFDRPGSTIERRKGEQVLDLFRSYENIISFIKNAKFETYMGLIMNKFIGDFFYCRKNLENNFIGKFDNFSRVFIKKYLHQKIQRDFISEYSNKMLDKLYNECTNEMYIEYQDFFTQKHTNASVSVIVPVHNLEKYLEQSINSILRQKLKNIEVVLINDGSQDNSKNIISKFLSDERVVLIDVNQPSGTPATPRNLGLTKARGEYIAFIDGDDWVEGEFLFRLYSVTQVHKSDIVYVKAFIREENGESKKFTLNTPELKHNQIDDDARIKLIGTPFFSNIWNRLYRREFLQHNAISFPKMYVSEDLAFSLVCTALLQSASLADTQGYHYRYNRPNSTTELRMGASSLKQVYAHGNFLSYLNSYNLNNNFQNYALAKKVNSYYYTWSRISDAKLKAIFRMQMLQLFKSANLNKEHFTEVEYKNYQIMLNDSM